MKKPVRVRVTIIADVGAFFIAKYKGKVLVLHKIDLKYKPRPEAKILNVAIDYQWAVVKGLVKAL